MTNYLLFSLQNSFDTVRLLVLTGSYTCRYSDEVLGEVCLMIGANMTHGGPVLWDPTDLAYTCHRVLCWILIASATISFCCPNAYYHRLFPHYPLLDSVCSIFYRPNLLVDLMHLYVSVYPALLELQRIVPQLLRGSFFVTGDTNRDFWMNASLLVVAIGGGSNWIASHFGKSFSGVPVHGFSSVTAASLAYSHRTTALRSKIKIFFFGVMRGDRYVTPGEFYWSILLTSFFLHLLTNSHMDQWIPHAIAWLVAGWAGSVLAALHLQDVSVFGDIFRQFSFFQ